MAVQSAIIIKHNPYRNNKVATRGVLGCSKQVCHKVVTTLWQPGLFHAIALDL